MVELHVEFDDGAERGAELFRSALVHQVFVADGHLLAFAFVVSGRGSENEADRLADVGHLSGLHGLGGLLHEGVDVFFGEGLERDLGGVAVLEVNFFVGERDGCLFFGFVPFEESGQNVIFCHVALGFEIVGIVRFRS